MPKGEVLNKPSINNLLQALEKVLSSFNPTTMVYLDTYGRWVENPETSRDRISNELWFTIWQRSQKDNYIGQIENLIYPFIRSESSWDITVKIFENSVSGGSITDTLLIVLEVLNQLIEYNAFKMNSEVYVADWDRKGQSIRVQNSAKAKESLERIQKILGNDGQMSILLETIELLKEKKQSSNKPESLLNSIFNKVSLVIAEEEKVRQSIKDTMAELGGSKKRNVSYAIDNEDFGLALGTITGVPQALVRPCLELLFNKDIPISSGLQFEASSILGALKDPRTSKYLLEILNNCDLKYTNLRCNLIYAAGNIRQKESLKYLADVLEGKKSIDVYLCNGTNRYKQTLDWEKYEAIWALGKLGSGAIDAVPVLTKYVNSEDVNIQRALAWTMASIGKEQKQKYGGIDASIVTTLMNLLTKNDPGTLEETIYSLKRLELPDFLHTLYLHSTKTIPILSLKPSSNGLYELSETIFHLISVKKPVVMAVTGDSGTGKTYFCEAIENGFGRIQKNDILYLMRDNPKHTDIFYRLLGIKLLKELLDPEQYQNYPYSENNDNPDAFFENFIKNYSGKKLIILDGWMDESYFYHVIKTFYRKSYLDIIVNFRTTFSTKRLNLEEREGLLENVKTYLFYVEKPLIEETEFYHDSAVLIYNLDNSITSRLNKEEIFEIFNKEKVNMWGDYIRIGKFTERAEPLQILKENFTPNQEKFSFKTENISIKETPQFLPAEANFTRLLNENIEENPNLLQIIKFSDFNIKHIIYYTQGQLVCCSYDGRVGILSGINDHILYTRVLESEPVGLALLGGDICAIDNEKSLKIVSFDKNKTTVIERADSFSSSITSDRTSTIVTGHVDGSIRIWDLKTNEIKIIKGHTDAVQAVIIDRNGRVYSGSKDKEVRVWNMANNKVTIFKGSESISAMGLYPDGRIVTGVNFCNNNGRVQYAKVMIVDLESNICNVLKSFNNAKINVINVYYDGRIMAGISFGNDHDIESKITILDPRSDFRQYKMLSKHGGEIRDCITMGPRIITCGSEANSEHTLRIWGTQGYVRSELNKLKLLTATTAKPSYYRTLF